MGRPSIAILAACMLQATLARADRVAVVPLSAPGREPPSAAADQLAADLISRGHRVIASSEVMARIATGNRGAGADWAAELLESVKAARAALTRLDRALASSMSRRIGNDIYRFGGGAGGAEVLVEWCLLERQLSLTASDPAQAKAWLDAAVAFGPELELDPVRHPMEERDAFARRRAAVHSQAPATFAVTTVPAAAEVWVDGVRRCEAPCSVTLVPGRHLARISSPAHAPATADVQLGPGATTSRRFGLSAAYSGASVRAIGAMMADASRRKEGASALEPMARFLDVDHVVAVLPEGDQLRVIVAPPAAGKPQLGRTTPPSSLAATTTDELRPVPGREEGSGRAWYATPTTWLIGGGVVAGVVAGLLLYSASESGPTGTITVMSPPGSPR